MVDEFGLPEEPNFEVRINLAPTQDVPVVVDVEGTRIFRSMRWGFVPKWARDGKAATGFINARVETAREKPSFRDAWKYRRCLVLATGYYEWASRGGPPTLLTAVDGAPIAFAGLWEVGQVGDRESLATCTILTAQAAFEIEDLHPRMPVILKGDQVQAWLRDGVPGYGLDRVARMSIPLETRLVSRKLNRVGNECPSCLVMDPQDLPPAPGLFD